MGNRIDFPLNNKMFLQKALNSLEKAHFEEALNYIAKVYETDKSTWINYIYASVLHNLNRNDEALELANEQKDTYLEHERYRLLYTLLLIKNHQFLEAEVIVQGNLNTIKNQYPAEWIKIAHELKVERDTLNLKIDILKKQTKSKLSRMVEYSRTEQNDIIRNAQLLDLSDLQGLAQQLFLSPDIPQLIKNAYLEVLVKKGDSRSYTLSWLNRQKEVVPRELSLFEEDSIVKTMDALLADKLQELPSVVELVKIELLNDLLLLYPFIDEVIKDVDYWVDHYINYFDPNNILEIDTTPLSLEQVECKKYLDYLDIIAQRQTPL